MVELLVNFFENNSIYNYVGVEIEYHNIVSVNTDVRVKFTDADEREYNVTVNMWEVMVFLNEQTQKLSQQ